MKSILPSGPLKTKESKSLRWSKQNKGHVKQIIKKKTFQEPFAEKDFKRRFEMLVKPGKDLAYDDEKPSVRRQRYF